LFVNIFYIVATSRSKKRGKNGKEFRPLFRLLSILPEKRSNCKHIFKIFSKKAFLSRRSLDPSVQARLFVSSISSPPRVKVRRSPFFLAPNLQDVKFA